MRRREQVGLPSDQSALGGQQAAYEGVRFTTAPCARHNGSRVSIESVSRLVWPSRSGYAGWRVAGYPVDGAGGEPLGRGGLP